MRIPTFEAATLVGAGPGRSALAHHMFEAQAARTPEATALVYERQSLSYAQLNHRANQLAQWLIGRGVGPDVCVAVCMERSLELVVAFLGVLKAGGAYVPFDPGYPSERLEAMFIDTRAPVILTQARLRERVLALDGHQARILALDDDTHVLTHEPADAPPLRTEADHLAYMIFTSGSSGKPKGVMVAHRGLCNVIEAQRSLFGVDAATRVLQFASISFDASIFEMVMALCAGASLHLASREALLPGPDLAGLLRERRISNLTIPPSSLAALPDVELPALRTVIVAGEACPAALVARWAPGREFYNAYGPTEATIWATTARCVADGSTPHIGRPIAQVQCHVLDAELRPVAEGEAGELCIAGVGVARGYRNRPELTAERFVRDPFADAPGSRMYRTGDQVRVLPDGNLAFLGRLDQQVKLRGLRIELGEIESVLAQHPGVREAVAVVRTDPPDDARLVGYVVAHPSHPVGLESAELRAWARRQLPEYMVPALVVVLSALPLTPNGKVDRNALPAPELRRTDVAPLPIKPPSTPMEQALTKLWAEVLRHEQIGAEDDFFAIGGHSLLAGQMLARLRETIHAEISLRMLFEHPTIAGMAAAIRDLLGGVEAADAAAARCLAGTRVEPAQIELFDLPRESAAAGRLPLALAQRLWLVDRFDQGNLSYVVAQVVRLTGPLDVAALERAIQGVVRRHEALRAVFQLDGDQVVQVIVPEVRIPLPVVDLEPLSEQARAHAVHQRDVEEKRRPFDLATGPLLRTSLLRLGAEQHLLLLTMHHIVVDDWSLAIFWRELSELYGAARTGRPAPLPAHTLGYADAVLHQRAWLQGPVLGQQLEYWRRQLADCNPVLRLPTDRPRPAAQTWSGARESVLLPPELSRALAELGRSEGATLFMTLLAAFQALLQRYSGQNDFLVGSPIANRRRREFEELIGFFVNTLALRADLSGDPEFRELLIRARETALGAYANQDLPFEQVVELVQPERDPGRNPLVQVVFALQNAPRSNIDLADLTAELLPHTSVTASFDLFLEMIETPDGLLTALEYNTDLYDASTMQRMLGHFQRLLEGVVADPHTHISALPLLSEAERDQVLVEWNQTRSEYPRNISIHALFEVQATLTPDAVALVCDGQTLDYAGLNSRANQLAHHLRDLGVGPDMPVLLCVERSFDLIVGMLGILKAGGAYVPLDPTYPAARLQFMIDDIRAPVAVVGQSLRATLPELPGTVVCLEAAADMLAGLPTDDPVDHLDPDHLAYAMYTSGSTGRPKGILVNHRNVVRLVKHTNYIEPTPDDVFLQIAPSAFDASTFEIWGALLNGARLVLFPPHIPTLEELGAAIRGNGVTILWLTTALFHQIVDQPAALASVRHLVTGGEVMSVAIANRALRELTNCRLINVYGPTENTTFTTFHPMSPGTVIEHTVPIGRPIANSTVYLLDAARRPVPIGVAGELYTGGDGVARGYLNRPELTEAQFVPDPFSDEVDARMYRTGDLARFRPDGVIEFLGRRDHQVKIRGFRIEIGEVEAVINEHPAVQETIVVAREDVPGDRRLVAYLVPNASYEATEALLAEGQDEHIADWQQLYDDTFGKTDTLADGTFDLTGWNSSYTDAPIAPEEMREQVDQVVARVLAQAPRRVLEIGVGTGLLLFRIAPTCSEYRGTDFSSTVLRSLEQEVQKRDLPQVRLSQGLAHELGDLGNEPFDLVLLNSVVQYFPNVDYLQSVMRSALEYVRPGGCIVVGDLRSYPLLRAYHTSVQLFRAAPTLGAEELRERIDIRTAAEEELLIDPAFFLALQQQEPRISHIQVQLRRGHHQNELTKFRYDVILHVERSFPAVEAQRLDWQRDGLSLERVREILGTHAPQLLLVQQIPNARLWQEVEAMRLLASDECPATAEQLQQAVQASPGSPVDPEALWALGAELGYITEVGWSWTDVGLLRAVFRRTAHSYAQDELPAAALKPLRACANYPVYAKLRRKLVPQVRAFLAEKLPDYMVPSAFVVLEAMPLTANGKIDRKALPAPGGLRHDERQGMVAPRNPLETDVAALWSELFGIERIGVHDNFFELGGHSLLAIRLTANVKATLGVDLPLRELFGAPTIAGFAQVIERAVRSVVPDDLAAALDREADTHLDPSIVPTPSDTWFTAEPRALFLTGATGFLGAFLLDELLRATTAEIHCLVRARSTAAGLQRLRETLEQYGLWHERLAERIVPVIGDLGQSHFGLGEHEFAALADRIDGVYHNGALVNFLYPYASLRAANVLGTQEVIRLACHGRVKPLHYVSTLAVVNTAQLDANGRVPEDAALGPIDGVDSGYVQTKWAAEHLVLAARARGLPVSIYRPSRIMGHSVTGASNHDDFMVRMIIGAIQLGSAPSIDKEENLAPVDFMAQAIVRLSLQLDAVGRIYHVMNPQPTRFDAVIEAIQQAGYPVQVVPFETWHQALFAAARSEQDNVLYPLLSFLSAMPTERAWIDTLSMPRFDCQNTLDGLSKTSIRCPPFGAGHVQAALAYFGKLEGGPGGLQPGGSGLAATG